MTFALGNAREWKPGISCTLTAISAISGKTPVQIHRVIKQAAASYGVLLSDDLLPDYDINHWLLAIGLLGGIWKEVDTPYANQAFENRPTVSEWILTNNTDKLTLVICNDGNREGHMFAAVNDSVVDTYTDGRIAKFTHKLIPADWPTFRVKRIFHVG
jgi:hypothetical protein